MDTKCELKKEEIERYCRQMLLNEIGKEGQTILKNAKVLIVGAGGLGAPCLMYLAGAGIGTLGIVDGDSVEESNLHRQIIHSSQKKGINKAISAKTMIELFNPLINVITFEEHLSNKNSVKICEGFDVLIDCSDNPATRYLVNDTAVFLNKPLVSGSAVKWEGQLTVYNKNSLRSDGSDDTPCYRCLFPVPTPPSAVCNCADAGVFGPVPGMIGTLQASECVKLLLGLQDKILAKRMLLFDCLDMNFKVIRLRSRNKNCVVCGSEGKQIFKTKAISVYDYQEFVNPVAQRQPLRIPLESQNNINWEQFNDLKTQEGFYQNNTLIDVRPEEQFKIASLENFQSIPLKELKDNFNQYKDLFMDKEKPVYVMCRRGNASTYGAKFLLDQGYCKVYNIDGGINEYRTKFDKNIPNF